MGSTPFLRIDFISVYSDQGLIKRCELQQLLLNGLYKFPLQCYFTLCRLFVYMFACSSHCSLLAVFLSAPILL